MKIAIVDDEPAVLSEMAAQLRAFAAAGHGRLEAVPFSDAAEFLAAFQRERFPMVFLDIFLPGLDGLAAAAQLRALDRRCLLIFLTSSEEFRQDALSLHAFEYITKPPAPARVRAVLQDALALLPAEEPCIEVVSGRRAVSLPRRAIVSAVTDAHYVDITLADGSAVRCRMTMGELLRLLDGDPRFLPVNKGIVLNADCVAAFADGCCIMENGQRLPVRVRDRAQLERTIREYHFSKIRGRQRGGL